VYVGVGFLEELAKLLALLLIARGMARHTRRDGIILGAAVGFGFAALESAGYAFATLLVRDGYTVRLSLGSMVFTELLRGILAPVGHGLWTGILGGVLFGAARDGKLRFTPSVLGAYVLVSLLHGLWDSMRAIALLLTELITTIQMQRPGVGGTVLAPPPDQVIQTFVTFQILGLAFISLVGLIVLWRLWSSPTNQRTTTTLRSATTPTA
jgi:RsiW-degrading membrane proteinase PrsW (M82 family)